MKYILLLTLAFVVRSAQAQPIAELHPVRNIPAGGAWHMCTSPEGHVYAATIGGLLRYVDSTWELITPDSIGNVKSVSTDGDKGLVIGTQDGRLYRSVSRELIDWIFQFSGNGQSEDINSNSDGVVLAAFTWEVYVSTDHGSTWRVGLAGGPQIRSVGLSSSILIALGSRVGSFKRMWTSTNLGVTWDSVTYFGGNSDLVIDERNRIVVAGYDQGISISADTGRSWIDDNAGLGDTVNPTRIVKDEEGTLFIATYGDGIYRKRTKDSVWSPINSGLFEPELLSTYPASSAAYSVALDSNGDLYASTESTFGYSDKKGDNWMLLRKGFTAPHVSSIESLGDFGESTGRLFVGGSGTLASTSSPTHSTWEDLIPGVGCDMPRKLFRASDGRLFALFYCGGNYCCFSSDNNGESWRGYQPEIRSVCQSGDSIVGFGGYGKYTFDKQSNLTYHGANIPCRHAVSNGGDTIYGSYGNKILISTDVGKSWQLADTIPHEAAENIVEGLAIDGQNRVYVQSFSQGGVYRWDPANRQLETLTDPDNSAVVELNGPFKGGVAVFTSGELRIYIGDRLYSWSIPSSKIYECGKSMGSRVYVGTQGGVFWLDLYALAKAIVQENTISSARLTIFPNPAQDEFTLDVEGVKQLYAVDVLGHHFPLRFDPSDKSVDIRALSRGCYIVLASDGKETRRALLTKY